jgi:hypothetical protein
MKLRYIIGAIGLIFLFAMIVYGGRQVDRVVVLRVYEGTASKDLTLGLSSLPDSVDAWLIIGDQRFHRRYKP